MPLDQQGFVIETKPEVTSDPFTVEAILPWLERQCAIGRAGEEYCWQKSGECLMAQYVMARGGKIENFQYHIGPYNIKSGPLSLKSKEIQELALGYPATFGAALDRAKKLLAERSR